jgi:hypothetical protein
MRFYFLQQHDMMMYIKIDRFFIFPLVIINLIIQISIVDIKLMAGPLCITHLLVVVRWFAYVVPSMCHQIIQASLACCYDLFLLTFFLSFFPLLLQWVVVE